MNRLSLSRFAAAALGVMFLGGSAWARADEPKEHKGYVRDEGGKITAVSRGPKSNYADDLKNSKFGAFDVVSQICFGGALLSGMKDAKLKDYTLASSAAWNETSFTVDQGVYNYNPNIQAIKDPRQIENWSRAYREGMHRVANSSMKDLSGIAKDGNNVPQIDRDRFVIGGQAKETPQYGSSGAAADNRSVPEGATKDGKRFAILVSWDKDELSDRHGVNIARMYYTLTTVQGIDPKNIAVLHADGAGKFLGEYVNTNLANNMQSPVMPSWMNEPLNNMKVPISAGTSRADWQSALAGNLFDGGKGINITKDDSVLIYNTGHGGHTGSIEKGTLGEKDENQDPISVRYIIPDKDNFNRNLNANAEIGGNVQESYIPDDLFKLQVSFDKALDLSKVKIRIDGGLKRDLTDGTDFDARDLDPLVAGALQHWRFKNLSAAGRLDGYLTSTVIDFYDVPAGILKDLGGKLMTAALLNSGDQEGVMVVIPAPGSVLLGAIGLAGIPRRRR